MIPKYITPDPLPYSDVLSDVVNKLTNELVIKLDDLMIEGLRRKGFNFDNRFELEDFIKSNCRCEERMDLKERTYFVNDIPFFVHYYGGDFTQDIMNTVVHDYGSYSFL